MERQFSNVSENLRRIRADIAEAAAKAGRNPSDIQLMAVTKTVPPQVVNEAIHDGVQLLGENRAQELLQKYDDYQRDGVSIHFIGHLQSNKVRQIADKVDMIHSVGSVKLAEEIHKQAATLHKVMDVLVEINVGGELSKSGVLVERAEELIREIAPLSHLRVRGLMAIPPFDATETETEHYFSRMHQLLVDIKGEKIDNVTMDVLSMGMSGDYPLAVKHGATILRLGSIIFGTRA